MKLIRPAILVTPLLLLAACSLLGPPVQPPAEEQVAVAIEPPKPRYAEPVDTHRFEIDAAHDDVR